MNADDERAFEQRLVEIGEHLRPAPGPRFYQRLARAPWQGANGMVSEPKARTRRWGWGAVEVAAVVLVVALVAVLGGVQWLGGSSNPAGAGPELTATPTEIGAGGSVVIDGTATPLPADPPGMSLEHALPTPAGTGGAVTEGGAATPLPTEPEALTDIKIIVVDPRTMEIMGTYQSLDELRAEGDWQTAGRVLFYSLDFGESYASVAEAFGLQPASLAASNPTLAPNAGDTLFVPPVDGVVYHVVAGDTLRGIADYYQVSVEAILNYAPNGLNGDAGQMKITQLLIIPGGAPRE